MMLISTLMFRSEIVPCYSIFTNEQLYESVDDPSQTSGSREDSQKQTGGGGGGLPPGRKQRVSFMGEEPKAKGAALILVYLQQQLTLLLKCFQVENILNELHFCKRFFFVRSSTLQKLLCIISTLIF